MKKIILTFLFVVAVSFGGTILHATHANADEITPSQAAALQESLNLLEAQFVQLEAEASAGQPIVQPAQATQPAVGVTAISPEDAAVLNTALTALAGALEEIRSGTVSPAAVATLGNVGRTLALIETSLNSNANTVTRPIAAVAPQPVAVASNVAPPAPAPEGNLAPLGNTPAPATADIASSWANKLPWIAIAIVILIIVGLMLWLWRRDKKDLSPAQ